MRGVFRFSSVVGYQGIEVKNGFNMIALNFQPVDGTEEIAISDLVGDKSMLVAGNGAASSDQIQVWDGEKFTAYFYRAKKTTNPKFTAGPAWVNANSSGTVTKDKIKRGAGVWFARPATAPEKATLTLSGSVSAEPYTHAINPGFNMISSAFPVDMALNNGPIDWVKCGAVAGNGAASSDQIQVWDGEKFTAYFYRAKKTTNPKLTAGPAWVNANSSGTVTTDVIPAGKGFWYARPDGKDAGTLEQVSPIAK